MDAGRLDPELDRG